MSITPSDIDTIVVKIGTSLLTGERGFDGRVIEHVVKSIARMKQERGVNVLIVSSGAMGCGMFSLGLQQRPQELRLKQAIAAIGQSTLVHYYETLFQTYGDGLHAAQVLITVGDLDDRQRYLNIRNTIKALFDMKIVVPVVNENDSVATEELRVGDNDTLAARVAAGIDADLLVILSDVDGLYDKNPAVFEDAKLLDRVEKIDESVEALAEDTRTQTTIGGMKTKLAAARIACAAGIPTILANGHGDNVLDRAVSADGPCTYFAPSPEALSHRKRWIAFGRQLRGSIHIDDGALRALAEQGRSLLAAGIARVEGDFPLGAAVRICGSSGAEIACGLTNYASDDLRKIAGHKSSDIETILGKKVFDEVIHRDNLVLR